MDDLHENVVHEIFKWIPCLERAKLASACPKFNNSVVYLWSVQEKVLMDEAIFDGLDPKDMWARRGHVYMTIASRCPNLKEFNPRVASGVNKKMTQAAAKSLAAKVAKSSPKIEILQECQFEFLVVYLSKVGGKNKIRKVDLEFSPDFRTDKGTEKFRENMMMMAEMLQDIEVLKINLRGWKRGLLPEMSECFSRIGPRLKVLHTNKFLRAFEPSQKLQHLNTDWNDVNFIPQSCPFIKSLAEVRFSPTALQLLTQFRNLTAVELHMDSLPSVDCFKEYLTKYGARLKSLILKNIFIEFYEVWPTIPKACPQLELLEVDTYSISGGEKDILQVIQMMGKLKRLKLSNVMTENCDHEHRATIIEGFLRAVPTLNNIIYNYPRVIENNFQNPNSRASHEMIVRFESVVRAFNEINKYDGRNVKFSYKSHFVAPVRPTEPVVTAMDLSDVIYQHLQMSQFKIPHVPQVLPTFSMIQSTSHQPLVQHQQDFSPVIYSSDMSLFDSTHNSTFATTQEPQPIIGHFSFPDEPVAYTHYHNLPNINSINNGYFCGNGQY